MYRDVFRVIIIRLDYYKCPKKFPTISSSSVEKHPHSSFILTFVFIHYVHLEKSSNKWWCFNSADKYLLKKDLPSSLKTLVKLFEC